jgi:hypothetical protein
VRYENNVSYGRSSEKFLDKNLINDKIIEEVKDFNYLACDIYSRD